MSDEPSATEPADTVELIRQAQAGDRRALDRALLRVRPRLEKWIALHLGPRLKSRLDIEDIVQMTLASAFQALEGLEVRDPGSLFAWFKQIARNRIRDANDWATAAKRDAAREDVLARSMEAAWTSPSLGVLRREEHERLLRALQGLSDDHRTIIRLVRIDGQSYAEASDLLGITVNLVGVRLLRALKALREALAEEEQTS